MKILVTIYHDPIGYPPTLNAVNELASIFDEVGLIGRRYRSHNWHYPENVSVIYSHDQISPKKLIKLPLHKKIRFFFRYVRLIRKFLRKEKPQIILGYDNMALMACWVASWMLNPSPLLWYHNHDVLEISKCKKFSLQWFSGYLEPRIFSKIGIFSLPSNERKQYFPFDRFKGKYFFLPNYPAISFYQKFFQSEKKLDDTILRLIYQGAITPSHGLEEIIPFLGEEVNNKTIYLTLIGPVTISYRKLLEAIAQAHDTTEFLHFHEPVSYEQLPPISAKHDIGLAINIPNEIIYATGGTASNKIYEYAALGLPVLLYDLPHYRQHLGAYKWAFFTDLSKDSFIEALSEIIPRYEKLHQSAWNDFRKSFNFGTRFKEIISYIKNTNS